MIGGRACTACDGDGYWHWFNGRGNRLISDDPCPRCDGTGRDPDDFPVDDAEACQDAWDGIMEHFHPGTYAARVGFDIAFGSGVRPEVAQLIGDVLTPTPEPADPFTLESFADRYAKHVRAIEREHAERFAPMFDFLKDRPPIPMFASEDIPEGDVVMVSGTDSGTRLSVAKFGGMMRITHEALNGPPPATVHEGRVMPDDVDLYPTYGKIADGWAELGHGPDPDTDRMDIEWDYCSYDWASTRVFFDPAGDLWFGYDQGASMSSPFDMTTTGDLTRIDRMQTWYDHVDAKIAEHRVRAADPAFTQSARLTDLISNHRRNRP